MDSMMLFPLRLWSIAGSRVATEYFMMTARKGRKKKRGESWNGGRKAKRNVERT